MDEEVKPEELDAIRKRLESATHTDLYYDPNDGAICCHVEDRPAMPLYKSSWATEQDGLLLANAPTDIAALLAEIERLRRMIHIQELPDMCDVTDDVSVELAVELATAEAKIEQLQKKNTELEKECDRLFDELERCKDNYL